MSAPIRTPLTSAVRCVSRARCISTSAPAAAEASTSKRPPTRRQPLAEYDIRKLEEFKFDDATSLGYMRLEKIREAQELAKRVEVDKPALQAQQKPFTPPKGSIRLTQIIDLTEPSSPIHNKRVLVAPVASLQLKNADAIQRIKLLAGPRWSPVPFNSGSDSSVALNAEAGYGADVKSTLGKEGWIKISEERFAEGAMNRKSASDVLDKLIEAANDPNSPLPASTPLDDRYIQARRSKSRRMDRVFKRAQAMQSRPDVVGGVQGFPKEWLAPGEDSKQ